MEEEQYPEYPEYQDSDYLEYEDRNTAGRNHNTNQRPGSFLGFSQPALSRSVIYVILSDISRLSALAIITMFWLKLSGALDCVCGSGADMLSTVQYWHQLSAYCDFCSGYSESSAPGRNIEFLPKIH